MQRKITSSAGSPWRSVWHAVLAVSYTHLDVYKRQGCTNERKENQTAYRQIGINAMESGDYAGAVDAFNSALGQCIGKITENELDICYYKAAAQYAGGCLLYTSSRSRDCMSIRDSR